MTPLYSFHRTLLYFCNSGQNNYLKHIQEIKHPNKRRNQAMFILPG